LEYDAPPNQRPPRDGRGRDGRPHRDGRHKDGRQDDGRHDDGRLDLPLTPGAGPETPTGLPGGRPPAPAGAPRRPPGELERSAVHPRHQRTAGRAAPGRRRGRARAWPWILALVLVAGGLAWWFFLRPPVAAAQVDTLEFTPTRVGRDGERATLEVSNVGVRRLQVLGVRVAGSTAEDFEILDDACTGAVVTARRTCAVELAFEPQAAGSRRASLEVTSNAAALSVPLAGEGLAPSLATDQERLDFGRIAVGKASGALAVALRNAGTAPLAVARLAVEGSGESSFVWVANNCSGETLEPDASCNLRIAFKPRETGNFDAELRIWSDAPEDPRVSLSGLGVAPGLFARPGSLDFGQLRPGQRSEAREMTLENTGNAPLEIARAELAGAGAAAFELVGNTCDGAALAADETCILRVVYAPAAAARHEASVQVRAAGLARHDPIRLTGTAVAPRLELGETLLDFGQVVQYGTNERSLAVRNAGSAPLELENLAVSGGGGAFGIARRGCGDSLAPGAECSVGLRFSPSRVGGVQGTLTVRHNAAGSPAEVRLLGTATALPAPGVAVEPAEVRFGALQVGERSDILTVKVRSTGTARLGLASAEIRGDQAADFHIVPASCEGLTSLLPDSDCTIGVRFRPAAAGRRRARLIIHHNASGQTSEVQLVGEGFGDAAPGGS
jgi:HYDIN/CFA65/VesB-like, Ig-like domain/Cep192 domain 4